MQPKVKILLSIFTFVAMVLTGLAAAEQVPTTQPKGGEPLLSPNIISLSPKLVRKKEQHERMMNDTIAKPKTGIHEKTSTLPISN